MKRWRTSKGSAMVGGFRGRVYDRKFLGVSGDAVGLVYAVLVWYTIVWRVGGELGGAVRAYRRLDGQSSEFI